MSGNHIYYLTKMIKAAIINSCLTMLSAFYRNESTLDYLLNKLIN